MKERPERISKLAQYLADKEPLIYLFIINTDFITFEDSGIADQIASQGGTLAAVTYMNNRFVFLYNPEGIEKLSREELYFLVIHEAFHIFKKHLKRHIQLFQENRFLANIAEDAVINSEIIGNTYNYDLKPQFIEGGVLPEENFFIENENIPREDALETFRYYNFLKNKKREEKKDMIRPGSYIRDKENDKYGKVTNVDEDGNVEYEEKTKQEVLDEMRGNKSSENSSKEKQTQNIDNVNPIVSPQGNKGNFKLVEGDEADYELLMDANEIFSSNGEQSEEEANLNAQEKNNFADNIMKQAEELEKKLDKQAGSGTSGLLKSLKKLNEPKVNWRKELRKRVNKFITQNSYLHNKRKSPINYPWDPKSRYGILGKWAIDVVDKIQNYVIFAIDTSGSVFFDENEMRTFFTELDFASKELQFSKTGKILTLQWDWEVMEGLKEYERGSWKKFKAKGGGGTNPNVIFDYFTRNMKDTGNGYMFKNEHVSFMTKSKKELPYLVILTDGFFHRMNKNDLGIYQNCQKNILWFARETNSVFPNEEKNVIKYN